jgi:E3 SUMO-protein ligase PIAS1
MYRQPGTAMGKAGRDPPVAVPLGTAAVEGSNRLSVQCQDQRAFSVLMRVVRRRTLDEVKGLVPAPASFLTARAYLERSLGGGGGGGGVGDDSDDDLILQDTAVLSLRCPVSGLICKTPARTRGCSGLAVFDLDTYLQLNAKVRDRKCQYHACTKPINHKP